MTQELLLQSITAIYALCNAARLLSYVPQIVVVARECSGAHALSLISWTFWSFSHAVTAIYCATVVDVGWNDVGKCHWVRRRCSADDDKTAAVRLEADAPLTAHRRPNESAPPCPVIYPRALRDCSGSCGICKVDLRSVASKAPRA